MEQTKALNALEPFLALSKSATSPRAAADLVVRATSAPNTYIFTELLQTPKIQALASSDEFGPYLTLLQIFSHGTYSAYTSTAGLPELNDAQRLKLRQLSLLTLAKKDSTTTNNAGSQALDYASLQAALDLPSRQALEELIISAIYAGLLKAQLNPKASQVQINSVSAVRDVAPTAISGLLSSLQAWAGRCDATLQSLSCQMTQLRADADRRAARAAARTQETRKLMEEEQKGGTAPVNKTSAVAAAILPDHPATATTAAAAAAGAAANSGAHRSRRGHKPPRSQTHSSGLGMSSNNDNDDDGGGNITTTTTNTITKNEMNSVLTVGGGSSSLSPSGPVPGASPAGAAHLQVKPASKRGSEDMDNSLHSDGPGAETMDLDGGDDDQDGTKRANRRKLGP